MAEKYPEAYESDLAMTLNNLANLYYRIQRYAESEEKYNECLEIRRLMAEKYPEAYESDFARTLGNLASLYSDIQRYAESEEKYNECLEIYRRLVKKYPEAYESDLAGILHNQASLYSESNVMQKARRSIKSVWRYIVACLKIILMNIKRMW
jgi:tetratricopeptide (TPR) repeat protein